MRNIISSTFLIFVFMLLETSGRNIFCNKRYDPVCGSDGVTYSNGCNLEQSNRIKSCDEQVESLYKGQCAGGSQTLTQSKTKPRVSQSRDCEDAVCLAIYKPVCGTDGVTYGNECALRRKNCRRNPKCYIKVAYEGECRSTVCDKTACTKIYDPVCGSDGVLYGNGCMLQVENCNRSCDQQIEILLRGECGTAATAADQKAQPGLSTNCEHSFYCPLVYNPICGTDGVTYGNECVLEHKNCRKNPKCYIKAAYQGECRSTVCDNPVCPLNYDPICGSDGVTYGNGCALQGENCKRSCDDQVKIAQRGECGAEPRSETATSQTHNCEDTACLDIYQPVCGTDGITYSNECYLGLENCRKNPQCFINIEYEGECRSTICERTGCPRNYDPICGSDGVTYGNGCLLQVENCNRSCDNQVKIARREACDTTQDAGRSVDREISQEIDCEDLLCLANYDPVCGTDGNTYGNACSLGFVNCRKNPKCYVKVDYKGECGSPTDVI